VAAIGFAIDPVRINVSAVTGTAFSKVCCAESFRIDDLPKVCNCNRDSWHVLSLHLPPYDLIDLRREVRRRNLLRESRAEQHAMQAASVAAFDVMRLRLTSLVFMGLS
jgi:hypothetical protein